MDQLEQYTGESLVIAGPEPFQSVKGGYKNIPPLTPRPDADEKGKPPEESYREKNKKRYGEVQRSDDQKIHNRTDPGLTKKITIHKNGDERFKYGTSVSGSMAGPEAETLPGGLKVSILGLYL